jgi:TPR repeat protein
MAVVDWIHDTPGMRMTASLRMILGAVLIAILALAALAAPIPDRAADAGWQAYQRGDYASALAAFEIAAKKGDRLAQFNLGVMLLRGEGKPVDLNTGIVWLTKAADAGMVQAQYDLGLLYESGIGVPRSLTAATDWWQKAAEQGHTEAQVQLATQYFLGRGAPKDWKLAAKWYEAAAVNGDPGAQYIIASFYEHGDGVPQDLRRALEWYVHAARQGDVGAAAQAKDVARRLAEARNAPR